MSVIKVLYLFFLTTFLNIFVYADGFKDLKEAIDISGKQRMLTQRFVKDYVMVGMELSYKNPKEDLKKSIDSFDMALKKIDEFSKDKKIKELSESVKDEWKMVKTILENEPSKGNIAKLNKKCDHLLKLSNDIVLLLTKQEKSGINSIINISGRQRMLSQKLAALYMVKAWGANDSRFKEQLEESMKLFKESLNRLKGYKENSKEINLLLSKVERAFRFFEVMSRSNSRFTPSLICKKSDEILNDMDKITKLYRKLK